MKNLIILIPPSEGKTMNGEGPPFENSDKNIRKMFNTVKKFDGDRGKLFGLKGIALEKANAANKNLYKIPTMPAMDRYRGVVYSAIEYKTLNDTEQARFNDRVRIISAMMGYVSPEMDIPDYKMKIDNLGAADFWKPIISKNLKDKFVVDLLPQSHKKAVSYDSGIEIEFYYDKGGKLVPAGHHGKIIKGKFIRWMITENITYVDDIKNFNMDGFKWQGEFFVSSKDPVLTIVN